MVLFAMTVLPGCISLAPHIKTPAVVAQMPDGYAGATSTKQYEPDTWWNAFNDPVLDQLVDDALAQNLDIAEAAGRVEQASAQARLTRSALLPSIEASAGATETSSPTAGSAFGGFGGGAINRIETENYTLGLGASYELDLFGRARGDFAAAKQDVIASQYDLQAVQLAAAAETIAAYFEIVDTRRQIEMSKLSVDVLSDRAARTDERFERGLVDSFELYQVRQDLRATQAALPQLESALVAAEGRLAVLTRSFPEQLRERLARPLQPSLVFEDVPAGLPAALLGQRPDVGAAWARLEASRLRIGARKAERFPRFSISGSLGTQGGRPEAAFDFADNWTSSLLANIVAPLIDGGRVSANIRGARAVYDQQATAYARSVLTAYSEVGSAIADYEEQRERYRLVSSQLAEVTASLDLQKRRFSAGVGNYITYLDASRAVYQVEASLSSAARSTALARLGVHRALAGDWAQGIASAPLELIDGDPDQISGDNQ
ncbi:MAG: efflux transporter outer membrane subunit [Erythrobacter sp.]